MRGVRILTSTSVAACAHDPLLCVKQNIPAFNVAHGKETLVSYLPRAAMVGHEKMVNDHGKRCPHGPRSREPCFNARGGGGAPRRVAQSEPSLQTIFGKPTRARSCPQKAVSFCPSRGVSIRCLALAADCLLRPKFLA